MDFEDNGFKIKEIKERKRVFGCLKIKKEKEEREKESGRGERRRERKGGF